MFTAYKLPEVNFQFGRGIGTDKFRGLQSLGPFKKLSPNLFTPKVAFVFPSNFRNEANKLYLGLKNGVGYFRGTENISFFSLLKDHVQPISEFELPEKASFQQAAQVYVNSILSWRAKTRSPEMPDIFVVLHLQTPHWEIDTPYYACKALLLKEGLLSQDVTVELINDSKQFEWSAANIALSMFVKLGGIPWVISGEEGENDLIIGVGRSDLFDPRERRATHIIGFTTCFSARGSFKFVAIANVARTREEYLKLLGGIVEESLKKARDIGTHINTLTLHLPKEFSRDENQVVTTTVKKHSLNGLPLISVVKITDEGSYFFIDDTSPEGVPRRGTVIQVADRNYVLFTEGKEETQVWRYRVPTALRISPLLASMHDSHIREAIRQVCDLSQVNWRGFNARSRPISIFYGSLIARILSHLPLSHAIGIYSEKSRPMLETRMWFL
jgi:hypothetical protein